MPGWRVRGRVRLWGSGLRVSRVRGLPGVELREPDAFHECVDGIMGIVSEMRPSFAERDAFRTALATAFADGRIDGEEFERRSTLIETGSRASDLQKALEDLPRPEVEFPTTLTRAEAIERRRTKGQRGSPKLSRRLLLAGGAAAFGFVVAGGLGELFGGDSADAQSTDAEEPAAAFIDDPAALQSVLKNVEDKGYTHFAQISIGQDVFAARARSLKTSSGADSLTDYGDGDLAIADSGHLSKDTDLFTLGEFALDLIPAMSQAAQRELGGTTTARVELGVERGPRGQDGRGEPVVEPVITVTVEGGEYGKDGGHLRWTGDGKELISIYRSDEG